MSQERRKHRASFNREEEVSRQRIGKPWKDGGTLTLHRPNSVLLMGSTVLSSSPDQHMSGDLLTIKRCLEIWVIPLPTLSQLRDVFEKV